MATEIVTTTLQFRRGKAATWAAKNPILSSGEPGFEKDTYKLKIGDGVTPWNELKYFLGDYTISPDMSTLTFNETGNLSLYGFNEASEGQSPCKRNSKLEWVDPTSSEVLSEEELLQILV